MGIPMGDIITRREKFDRGWSGGGKETPCGSGSKLENTVEQRVWLPEIAARFGIRTVADVGAGDLNWMRHMDWDVEYTPYDLVPRRPEVIEFDLVRQVPPTVDAILCLWVLNHMPFEDCRGAIRNLKASGSRYLIMTDRPIWHHEQPPEIQMEALETLVLNAKGDQIKLVELCGA